MPDYRNGRPTADTVEPANVSAATKSRTILAPATRHLADLDAHAEAIRGRFAVQVVVDAERGHRRTYLYRNAAAAERAVARARARGQSSHVTLVQLLPVGVVVGLDGGAR